jgi:NUMOD3 motif.
MENKRQFREPDEATKQKMSFRKQGCNNPNFGKPRSEETKRLISDKLKEYWKTIPSSK